MPNLGPLSPQAIVLADYLSRLTVSNGQSVPGFITTIAIPIPDAATGNVDVVVSEKVEIVRVRAIKRGGAGAANTMQVFGGVAGATAVTAALACAVDDAATDAASIAAAGATVLAGDIIRVTATRAAGTRTALVLVDVIIRP